MTEEFDPYHVWLGIPPEQQPPDHYRLLGLARYESDRDVIENAGDQRMAYIRKFQTGPRATWTQRLLNEGSAAKLCLLDSTQKAAYDVDLRIRDENRALESKLSPLPPPVPPPQPPSISTAGHAPLAPASAKRSGPPPPPAIVGAPSSDSAGAPAAVATSLPASLPNRARMRKRSERLGVLFGILLLIAVMLGAVLWWIVSELDIGETSEQQRGSDPSKSKPRQEQIEHDPSNGIPGNGRSDLMLVIQNGDGSADLLATAAQLHGSSLRLKRDGSESFIDGLQVEDCSITWNVAIARRGFFRAEISYRPRSARTQGRFRLSVGDDSWSMSMLPSAPSGSISTAETVIRIGRKGETKIVLDIDSGDDLSALELISVRLIPRG